MKASPKREAIVALAGDALSEMRRERRVVWSEATALLHRAEAAGIGADAMTPFGDIVAVLSRPPEGGAEQALARALFAHVVACEPAGTDVRECARLAREMMWMATHTPFDALGLVDSAFQERAPDVWRAIVDAVREIDSGRGGPLGRAEAIVAATALGASAWDGIRGAVADLASGAEDAGLAEVLRHAVFAGPPVEIEGELLPRSRPLWATTLLGVSGVLTLMYIGRTLGRFCLGIDRHACVRFDSSGAHVEEHSTLFGRPHKRVTSRFPARDILRVTTAETEQRPGLLGGVAAFGTGSFIGGALLADGVRAASPPLLFRGLLFAALGLLAELTVSTLLPAVRRSHVVSIATADRTAFRVAVRDAESVRALLERFSG